MDQPGLSLTEMRVFHVMRNMPKDELIVYRKSLVASGEANLMALADTVAVGRFLDAWIAGEFK